MTKNTEQADEPQDERLDYSEANERARSLRAEAESILEEVDQSLRDPSASGSSERAGAAALGLLRVLVLAVLEVGARLELLELDAELGREGAK